MASSNFGILLEELGKTFGNIQLQPDEQNSCMIKLPDGLIIQVEMSKTDDFLILGCKLGEVPAGRYRENLLNEALKFNSLPHPTHGILAYSPKTNQLVFYQKMYAADLTGEKIAEEIGPFTAKASAWTNALKSGTVPSADSAQPQASGGGGIFGLK